MGVSAVDMDQAVRRIEQQIESRQAAYVCVANFRVTLLSQQDPTLCGIQNRSLLTLPDGMPLVWYGRLAGRREVRRVTGPDLLLRLLDRSQALGHTHYFLGDTPDTLRAMRRTIRQDFPGARVLAMRSPPFHELSAAERQEIIDEINRLEPSIVWVGLGAPKQEFWMAQAMGSVRSSVLIGVGAAFRFLIGEYRHPPKICQNLGLEGLFWRLPKRPAQVLARYCRYVPAYSWLVVKLLLRRAGRRQEQPQA